jgi:hypothetical protein
MIGPFDRLRVNGGGSVELSTHSPGVGSAGLSTTFPFGLSLSKPGGWGPFDRLRVNGVEVRPVLSLPLGLRTHSPFGLSLSKPGG